VLVASIVFFVLGALALFLSYFENRDTQRLKFLLRETQIGPPALTYRDAVQQFLPELRAGDVCLVKTRDSRWHASQVLCELKIEKVAPETGHVLWSHTRGVINFEEMITGNRSWTLVSFVHAQFELVELIQSRDLSGGLARDTATPPRSQNDDKPVDFRGELTVQRSGPPRTPAPGGGRIAMR
jgi:hypothetical protein